MLILKKRLNRFKKKQVYSLVTLIGLCVYSISWGKIPSRTLDANQGSSSNKEQQVFSKTSIKQEFLDTMLSTTTAYVPWSSPLQQSARYQTSLRLQAYKQDELTKNSTFNPTSIDRLGGKHHSVEEQVEGLATTTPLILSPLDEYILAKTSVEQPLPGSDPFFEAQISLSHTWRHGPSGYLLNAQQMEKSPFWLNRRFKNYGTPEMIATIKAGVKNLRKEFPKAPKLIIGDLSKRYGGHFPPHLSHQSGRDADIGYFIRGKYSHQLNGLTLVNRRTIDVQKTWAFLSGMLRTGLVESAFIDYQLQKVLYRHALNKGDWTKEELKTVFSYPLWKGKIISHLRGHSDHMHVRFKAPLSQARAKNYMAEHGWRKLRAQRVYTKPKKGENLVRLAKRFRVSWKTLMKWNRLTLAQARRALPPKKRLIVGYYTPYYARHLKFPKPEKELLQDAVSRH